MELANQDDDKEVFGGGGAASDMEEKSRLLAEMEGSLPRSPSGREVKIKITKKELEELLARVDMQGVTLEHVLAQLMINVLTMIGRPICSGRDLGGRHSRVSRR
ncbi:hypothetical protein CK203_014747 [Vitis vinifera]|uniref:Uncharacterized protein n=1 Tax=Vitis vinifera TaxID=29760 RepID=A0A438JG67_VITVI|nr:hypothetical protein CK203_014747 [Vitis vinifera]